MEVPKPTDADRERFRSLVPVDPGVEVKPMFGNLGAFVNGNMFLGLFGDQVGVRLDPETAAELRAAGGGPYGPAERPMGGWVSLPAAIVGGPEAASWVARSLAYVAAMPPKPPKRSR